MKWEFSWNGILKFCFLKITIDGINLTFQSFKWKLKRIERQSMEGKSKKEMMDRKVKEKEDRRLKVRRPICSRLYRDSCGDTWYNCPSNIFLPILLSMSTNCSTISRFRIRNKGEEEWNAKWRNLIRNNVFDAEYK